MPDLEQWPTVFQAAKTLKRSPRTIGRYGAAGKIEIRERQRKGKKPEPVCNPRDVDRLMPPDHVMPDDEATEPLPETGLVPLEKRLIAQALMLREILNGTNPPSVRPWMSIEEAAEWSGLTEGCVRRAAREGKVVAVRGGPQGALRIRRASLEAFEG